MVKWTPEQEKAIYTEGKDILVSAAAGSGKTAVLVERIIQKLLKKEDPLDIDSLLVVTFTNAAAQEMRNRVGAALEKSLEAEPTSIHLKKQLSLLQRASISTLHSFCMDVVRQYAYLLDIDPGFRIANEMEADLMQQEVLDDLFEEWYGREDTEGAQFFSVVDRFSNDRSDIDVEELILALYTFSIQNPWPEQWLDDLANVYAVPESWHEADLVWLKIIKKEVQNELKAFGQELELARMIAEEADGPYHYLETIEADEKNLEEALAKLDSWDELQGYFTQSSFVRLSSKRVECDSEKREKVKTLRNSYRKRWTDMKGSWFSRNLASHIQDMRELAPVIKTLTQLVKEFKTLFTERKKEKAIVDFSDLEHYCLQLLLDESSTPEHTVPSTVALNFKERFKEVLVDEYQDTNLVQETMLTLISDQSGPGNMFMVGDVKQSVYRFRHAEPSLFIDKYNRFIKQDHPGERIDLARNFRSREHVLIGANYLFRQILDEEVGEINYDHDAELIYANNMYDTLPMNHPEPELLIIDNEDLDNEQQNEGEEDYQDLEKAQLEARAYAKSIKKWIGDDENKPFQVVDKATQLQRDIEYRDIVLLMRSMTWAPVIMEEFNKQGIPVYAELSSGYFEAIEIKVIINYLKIIDNPRQDIPLASVLRSPMVRLQEEELASIRLANKHASFYEALVAYRKQNSNNLTMKIELFLEQLNQFRAVSRRGALSELIWQVYRETGFYDFVGGMPGGRQRQANLRALYDRSRSYETTSYRGLFRFLRFIERMEERGDDLGAARGLSEQEDVVRIMTIHKSKGLEFPVVIVGGMNRQFNLQDLNQKYLLDKDFGFASKFIDPVKRITYPTLYYYALRNEMRRKQLAEEVRVLYVALTRAKEKIVMVANVPSFVKKQEKWQQILDHPVWVLPAYFRLEAKTFLDWIGPALIRHQMNADLHGEESVSENVLPEIKLDPSKWDISIIHGSELTNIEEKQLIPDEMLQEKVTNWKLLDLNDKALDDEVNKRLSFQYAYKDAVKSRAKQTVTEIKRQQEIRDEYSSDQFVQSYQAPIIKRPNFMQTEKVISAAERGTIMHTVMQHLPLTSRLTENEIKRYIEQLIEKEIITEEAAQTVDVQAIEGFYTTPLAEQIMKETTIYREVPFSLSLSAKDVYSNWNDDTDEQVLIQGVIDCIVPYEDGWMILDYKTDAINEEINEDVEEMLIQRYRTQMNLYCQAVESIWKQPVKRINLYFFSKSLVVDVPLS